MFFYLMCLSYFDIKEKKVPLVFIILGWVVTVACAAYGYWQKEVSGLQLFWGVVPGMLLWLLSVFTEEVGAADGLVLMQIGILSGLWGGLQVLTISLILMSAAAWILCIIGKLRRKDRLPFLPFLCAGYVVGAIL